MSHVDITPCRLNVVEAGSGEVIVLLHGLGSSHRDWAAQIDALSRTHRVIAFDLRGHGGSPAAAPGISLEDLAASAGRSAASSQRSSPPSTPRSFGALPS
jgi:pimeloyl-ACP methyl ester carboxylesterase